MRLTILQQGTFNLGEWDLDAKTSMIVAPGVVTRVTDEHSVAKKISEGPRLSISQSDGFLYMRPDLHLDDAERMSLIGYQYDESGIGSPVFVPRSADLSFPLVLSETPKEELGLTARRLAEPMTFYELKKDTHITIIPASQIRTLGLSGEFCLAMRLIPQIIGHEVGPEGRKKYIGDFVFEDDDPPILLFPSGKEGEWSMIYPVTLRDSDIRRLAGGKLDEKDMIMREKAGAFLGELLGPRGNMLKQVLEESFGLSEAQIRMLEGQLKSSFEVGPVILRDGAELLKREISLVLGETKG